ncbi:hypothetical protein MLD38_031224 [Melastoma candidum]|uniref:Uncharacterized protein n=1 Tax=Melastoma candidum TaxID=119954 RepID=A0ACB9MPK8_9MYRT|nr:hypothetical protein MLD38_031224 [Melastoma candidum]
MFAGRQKYRADWTGDNTTDWAPNFCANVIDTCSNWNVSHSMEGRYYLCIGVTPHTMKWNMIKMIISWLETVY